VFSTHLAHKSHLKIETLARGTIVINSLERSVHEEIETRIRLYDFSTGKQTFFQWQAGMLPSLPGKRVLELGCGSGDVWTSLLPRWSNCELTLTDISEEILVVAQETLMPFSNLASSLKFVPLNFNELAAVVGPFDVIVANHNLFYAQDIDALLASIAELLSTNGVLICSTVGQDHLHELATLLRLQRNDLPWGAEQWATCFGLENGRALLQQQFSQVDQFEYDNSLHVNSVEPVMAYLLKTMKNGLADWVAEHYHEIRAAVSAAMVAKGYLRLTPHSGFFIAHKNR
jgi:ubiquinone/menaquinone biosynthesis C-methylase UbiE